VSVEGSTKAIVAALFANLGIAIAKFVAFLFTRSVSMLAESIHSAADTSNQGLLLLGGHRARRAATPLHPFGFGRERYFWSFVVALVLFSLGGVFALYEGLQKLMHPHDVASPGIAIGVLIFGIALESFSLATAVRESRIYKGDKSWWSFIRHSRNPELPVVLLEDIGAMIGLVVALVAVSLTAVTHNSDFDAFGTMTIGVLLLVIAVLLMIEMKGLLIGEAAERDEELLIAATITAHPEIYGVIHLRTQHIGPEELIVGAKVHLNPALSVAEVAGAINEAERSVREVLPTATMIYIEPDVLDPTLLPPPTQ
jgi:cation diffusion facilitator family transporter